MSGIHVRAFGKHDWNESDKEPALTVPGAYWLCHKRNIFKFTLKYHKTLRNIKQEFGYGRELMKVIRRIIKSQPRQGQQFGTRHLIVTYNYSAWTRQDKMFAMLKFQERVDVTVYPRAFVLTVKILSGNTISYCTTKYMDGLIVYRDEPRRGKIEKKQNNPIHGQENLRLSTMKAHGYSSDCSSRLELLNSTSSRLIIEPIQPVDPQKLDRPSSAFFLGDLDNLPLLERYLLEQRDRPGNVPRINHTPFNDLQETIDMPYQYLIEREIENSKANSARHTQLEKAKHSSQSDKSKEMSLTSRNKTRSAFELVDNVTTRSENITDLVMEGLMFTIRQDQGSVTVVEQKTELEPDEVLENSERIETKEGAECLVNSCLVKLENLVTRIENSNLLSGHHRTMFATSVFGEKWYSNDGNRSNEYSKSTIRNDINTPSSIIEKNRSREQYVPTTLGPMTSTEQNLTTSDYFFFDMDLKSNMKVDSKIRGDKNSNPVLMDEGDPFHLDNVEKNEGSEDFDMNSDILPESSKQNDFNILDNLDSYGPSLPNRISTLSNLRASKIISSEIVENNLSSIYSVGLNKSPESFTIYEDSNSESEDLKDILYTAEPAYGNRIKSSDEMVGNSTTKTNRKSRRMLIAKQNHGTFKAELGGTEIQIKMWKFLQDMTRGVRVVVKRLDLPVLFGRKNASNNKNS